MGRPFKCPYCGASDSIGKGIRHTKGLGLRRVRRCRACQRKFTPRNQKPLDAVDGSSDPTIPLIPTAPFAE